MQEGMGCLCPDAIPHGDEITSVVGHFAMQHDDLVFRPFYHDLPVWIVSEHDHPGFVHRLQISATQENGEFRLTVFPTFEYLDPEKHRIGTPREVPENFVVDISLVSGDGSQLNADGLTDALKDGWKIATSIGKKEPEFLDLLWTPLPAEIAVGKLRPL